MSAELTPQDAGRLLAVGRLAIGAGGWAAPGLAARALGVAQAGDAPAGMPLVFRLFASRDLVLGVGLLSAVGRERDRWLVLGMAADAADAVAALIAGRRGQMPAPQALVAALTAMSAVALGARARR